MKNGFYLSFVNHTRFIPKRYSFNFHFFWAQFNLEELDELANQTPFFSRNRLNLFSFYDRDHLNLGKNNLKDNVLEFLYQNSEDSQKFKQEDPQKIRVTLITNPRILGYTFNPVSFYLIETSFGPYLIIEIGNTFSEQKPYILGPQCLKEGKWKIRTPKHFYISPFASVQNEMAFEVSLKKGQSLKIIINDFKKNGKLEIKTTYHGEFKRWSTVELLKLFFKFPFLTHKIIFMIHFHALILYLKKIPYFKKDDESSWQTHYFKK